LLKAAFPAWKNFFIYDFLKMAATENFVSFFKFSSSFCF
jgi:hypothetical protein